MKSTTSPSQRKLKQRKGATKNQRHMDLGSKAKRTSGRKKEDEFEAASKKKKVDTP